VVGRRRVAHFWPATRPDSGSARKRLSWAGHSENLARADGLDVSHNRTLAPLLTEIYVLSWLRLGREDDLARARNVQIAIHQATGDRIALSSAAVLTWHLGGRTRATEPAREALSSRPDLLANAHLDCRALATVALAALIADAQGLG